MAQAGRFGRRLALVAPRRRSNRWTTLWLMLLAFLGSAAVASLVLGFVPLRLPGVPAVAMPTVAASFPVCGGGARSTCVVDGDTFWLEGTKYRIADIDTPEVSNFGCAAEKALGDRATERLAALLNAGPFALEPADRDPRFPQDAGSSARYCCHGCRRLPPDERARESARKQNSSHARESSIVTFLKFHIGPHAASY